MESGIRTDGSATPHTTWGVVTGTLRPPSAERYRALVESTSIGVFRAGPDGAVLDAMRAWEDLAGPGHDAVGWSWLDDVHPLDRDRVHATWTASLRTGEPYDATYRVRHARGGSRWIRSRAVAVRARADDAASPVLEWIGAIDDVTHALVRRTRNEALMACAETLARAITVDDVVRSLQQVAAPALGALAVAVGIEDDRKGMVVHQAGYPDEPPTRYVRVRPATEGEPWPLLRTVMRTGRPMFIGDVAETGAALAGARGTVPVAPGEVRSVVLPMRYSGRTLGAVRFSWDEPQPFDAADEATLTAIGAQHSAALARAWLYQNARDASLTLQAALAPAVPRRIGPVSIGMHYRPAGEQAQVGGDWADAIRLLDGRIALVVGDVMGSGIEAAATMGRLRTSMRALALHVTDGARLLADLDRLMLADGGTQIATVALAVVDPHEHHADLYSAGHLPAFLALPSGEVASPPPGLTPPVGLGWSAGPLPAPRRIDFTPGDVLMMYTDGLVETRTDPLDARIGVLRDHVAGALPLDDLDRAAAGLVADMNPAADDDVTLLLARPDPVPGGRPEPEPGPRSTRSPGR